VRLDLRRAVPGDAELLLAIHRTSAVAGFADVFWPERYPFPDAEVLAGWRDALADPDVETWLASEGGEAVALVSIGADVLRTLFVLPERWSHGIGSALHDHALERLQERGVTRARLWALEANALARAFYERRGWQLTGETRSVPFPPHPLDVEYARDLASP
jgi:GNAT superfamily N-acetyltransferase